MSNDRNLNYLYLLLKIKLKFMVKTQLNVLQVFKFCSELTSTTPFNFYYKLLNWV